MTLALARAGGTNAARPRSAPARRAVERGAWAVAAAVALSAVVWGGRHDAAELVGDPLERPSAARPLGTNNVGQDLLRQLATGTRSSLAVAAIAALLATTVAFSVALVAAWSRPAIDRLVQRTVSVLIAVPRLPLLVLLGTYAGTSLWQTAAIIAIVFWPGSARLLRARLAGLRAAHHVRAAYGFGARARWVVARHVLPEVTPVLLASVVLTASRAVMVESGLALLGIGDVTRVSWGTTIRQALEFRSLFRIDAWRWWLVPPIVAVAVTTAVLSALAESIERRSRPTGRAAAR